MRGANPLMHHFLKWSDTLAAILSDHFETLCVKGLMVTTNIYPANIYLLKVNNRNIRKRWEICSKSTIKTPDRRH